MSRTSRATLVKAVFAVTLVLPVAAQATNGMFMIGFGAKQNAVGGTGIALVQDAFSGASNPATVALTGRRGDLGMDVFNAQVSARLGTLHQDSVASHGEDFRVFFIPHLALNWKGTRRSGDWAWGFSFAPAGGGGSRYQRNLYVNANNPADPNVASPVGVSLNVAQMNPTFAFQLGKSNYVGFAPVIGVQNFRAIGLSYFTNFTSSGINSTFLTDNGNDWSKGLGLRLGWLGKFGPLSFGAVAQSQTYMERFEKYKELFAEAGSLNTPAHVGLGMAWKIVPSLSAGLDVTHTFYEDVAAIGNSGPNTSGSPYPVSQAVNALGLDEGLGFGWTNQTVYKMGAVWEVDDRLTLRGGWNYGKSPIPEENGAVLFNITAPATTQNHATLGMSYRTNESKKRGRYDTEWSAQYVHAYRYTQSGPTYVGGTGSIQMRQNQLGVTYGMKF